MAHTSALYTVRVKERYKDYQPLGDIDGSGTKLQDVLAGYLNGFEEAAADGDRVVRALSQNTQGDDLEAVLLHGQSGVVADIVDSQGTNRIRQVATDTQLLRCSALFRLPPTQDMGWLALQVNNGRGIKGLLEVGLHVKFRDDFEDLMLQIRPFVVGPPSTRRSSKASFRRCG